MAMRRVCACVLRTRTDSRVIANNIVTSVSLRRRTPPPGQMPNEDIDTENLASQDKYRSYNRYLRRAEEAKEQAVWWNTYRGWVERRDPDHGAERVDIGLPLCRVSRTQELKKRRQILKENKKNLDLERASRLRTLKVPLDRVQDSWERSSGPFQILRLADHYGVFRDLFPMAFFLPQTILRICHSSGGQVHYGNHLTPTEAASAPEVSFRAQEGSLWTLLLTCPDEHLQDAEGEYVHWLVGNIPGAAVQSGQVLCDYLPPFPARGTGFHRYVYILFKQDAHISFEEDGWPSPCRSLADRTFKTVDFYRKHQDELTPAGLSFIQCRWDESVANTFHDTFNMKEPVFEFIRPPVYHPPQVKYPHKQPLRYLDRYRDGREHTYGIY